MKCKYCDKEYEERCIHNPSHNFKIEKDGFENAGELIFGEQSDIDDLWFELTALLALTEENQDDYPKTQELRDKLSQKLSK